jgi:hypothetical protein
MFHGCGSTPSGCGPAALRLTVGKMHVCSVPPLHQPSHVASGSGISEPKQYGTGSAKWNVIACEIDSWFTPISGLWGQPELGVNLFLFNWHSC